MLKLFGPKIGTERLILRNFKQADFYDYSLYASDPEVMLAAGSEPMKSPDDRKPFNDVLKDTDCFAIVLKETDRVIGQIKYQKDFRRFGVNSISIGYELAKAHWGKGYMTEALKAVVKYAFERKKVDVVAIGHFTVNEKSKHVIQKCGFNHEGTILRAFKRFDGEIFDDETYSILKEDYFANPEQYNG